MQDIVNIISEYLTIKDRIRLRMTCKTMKSLINIKLPTNVLPCLFCRSTTLWRFRDSDTGCCIACIYKSKKEISEIGLPYHIIKYTSKS